MKAWEMSEFQCLGNGHLGYNIMMLYGSIVITIIANALNPAVNKIIGW